MLHKNNLLIGDQIGVRKFKLPTLSQNVPANSLSHNIWSLKVRRKHENPSTSSCVDRARTEDPTISPQRRKFCPRSKSCKTNGICCSIFTASLYSNVASNCGPLVRETFSGTRIKYEHIDKHALKRRCAPRVQSVTGKHSPSARSMNASSRA